MTYVESFSLKNKTVLITGAAGILGKEFCNGLAEYNANIALVDINGEEAFKHARLLTDRYGIKAKAFECDVSSLGSVKQMVEDVVKDFAEINVLHNNAAGKTKNLNNFFAKFEDFSLETWNEIMSVNLSGMFLVAQAVGKVMLKQNKGGSIIQTASIYGMLAPDQRIYEDSFYMGTEINTPAVYTASKAAVIGLTKYLAAYWGDKGIRVNCISPGGVESGQNDIFVRKYANRTPLNRMAKYNEIVGALIYLASDASSYVTGQNFAIDGGLSAW